MKPERLLLTLVALLLLGGFVVWATSTGSGLPTLTIGLWVGAFGVSMLPLLGSLLAVIWERRGPKNPS